MNEITILKGLPRAGKSTYRKVVEEYRPSVFSLSADDIRDFLHPGIEYSQSHESLVWKIFYQKFTDFCIDSSKREILIDNANTYEKFVLPFVLLGLATGRKVTLVHITTSEEECYARAMNQGNTTLANVVKRMAKAPGLDTWGNLKLSPIEASNSSYLMELKNPADFYSVELEGQEMFGKFYDPKASDKEKATLALGTYAWHILEHDVTYSKDYWKIFNINLISEGLKNKERIKSSLERI